MQSQILDYIRGERVGVLAVTMPDGSPHGAAVHFAFDEATGNLLFITSANSKKGEALSRGEIKASFVVGASEETMKTLQLDGVARVEESEELKKIYFEKFPEKAEKFKNDMLFTFTPTWWRFTDYKTPTGRLILSSE